MKVSDRLNIHTEGRHFHQVEGHCAAKSRLTTLAAYASKYQIMFFPSQRRGTMKKVGASRCLKVYPDG